MDLSKIGSLLKSIGSPIATIAGTAIGGPQGGAIGKVVVDVLAGALGVPATEDAVAEAAAANPNAAKAALDNSLEVAQALAQAQVDIIRTVNETMRLELQHESVFIRHARPACIWACMFIWTIFGVSFAYQTFRGNFEVLTHLLNVAAYMGPMQALAGVIAMLRTQEKNAGVAGGSAPSLGGIIGETIGTIIKPLGRKK